MNDASPPAAGHPEDGPADGSDVRVVRGGTTGNGQRFLPPTLSRLKTFVRFAPFMPAYPLHREEPVLPIFIVGSGRSGTTLMRRILIETGQIHIPPEVHALPGVIANYRALSALRWEVLVRLTLAQFEYSPGFEQFDITLGPLALDLDTTPPSSRCLARIIDRFYMYHADLTNPGPVRWGDKTPLNVNHLEPIRSVFPAARFIHMLRDGCDVVASCLEMGRYSSVGEAAQRWLKATRDAERFQAHHPEACITVRYEDLVTDPESVADRVCRFTDLEFAPGMLESTARIATQSDIGALPHLQRVLTAISPDRIGAGRRILSRETRQEVQSLIGKDLARLGYQPCL